MSSRIIKNRHALKLSGKDTEFFVQSLLKPKAPNTLLVATMKRYRKVVSAK